MKYNRLILSLAVAAMIPAAMAQSQLKVSTGSPSGTYSKMFKEFQAVCKDQILQIEMPSSGSIENVDRLVGNEANAAIVQTDVLYFRARNEDLSGVKTLFSLFPEEVHVITKVDSPIHEGGTLGIGKKPIQLNKIEDLNGRTVVSWGGSFITAQVIRLQSEIGFNVAEVKDFKQAKEALDSGQAAAIIMVGGQPMADVASLNRDYKLIPFSDAVTGKLKAVYSPAKVTYSGMGQGGSGIQTIATDSLFVTRAYKTPKMVESLAALRSCFVNNVDAIAEQTGTHKKWASVKVENQGKWAWYELPSTQPVVTVGKKK